MKNINMIQIKLLNILDILVTVNETNWKNVINNFYNMTLKINSNNEFEVLVRDIISIYNGMGSFSDLVLYENNQLCIEENNKLDQLRHDLYNELKNAI
jgi:hypothetical protein